MHFVFAYFLTIFFFQLQDANVSSSSPNGENDDENKGNADVGRNKGENMYYSPKVATKPNRKRKFQIQCDYDEEIDELKRKYELDLNELEIKKAEIEKKIIELKKKTY